MVTMAVCYGIYFAFTIRMEEAAPYVIHLGSKNAVWFPEAKLRYAEFYKELFTSFDLYLSWKKLVGASAGYPSDFELINGYTLFQGAYRSYLNNSLTHAAVAQRTRESQTILEKKIGRKLTKVEENKFATDFSNMLFATKDEYYRKHVGAFFMIDKYPDNAKRFEFPPTCDEFLKKDWSHLMPILVTKS